MNNGEIYETKISDARWIAYDIPGNIGWIMYIICIVIFLKKEVNVFSIAAVIPAIIMLVGIIELISERIVKLDRVLPKIRLYRGFGALTLGGICGIVLSAIGLFVVGGANTLFMLIGSILCTVFGGLLFAGYSYKRKD